MASHVGQQVGNMLTCPSYCLPQLTKKQANAFGAFFAKAGTSPVNEIKPTPSYSTPSSSGIRNTADTKSDYATHFKPFFVRNGVEVAPINMFRLKRDKGKQVQEVDEMDIDKEWTVAGEARTITVR